MLIKPDSGMKPEEKLKYWKDLLLWNETQYKTVLDQIDQRDKLRNGEREITNIASHGASSLNNKDAQHVRNIVFELIEAQVDSSIPQPKVTSCRVTYEELARRMENDLRNELTRLPFYEINDIQERICKTHGSCFYYIDWDSTKDDKYSSGEIVCEVLHPKQLIPQDGIVTDIQDMDYFFLKFPQTKDYLEKRYGVTLDLHSEEEPGIRSDPGESTPAEDLYTQYVVYYRNDDGTIGMFSWVLDTVLCDYEDYQARWVKRCTKCGEVVYFDPPGAGDSSMLDKVNTSYLDAMSYSCPKCGNKSFKKEQEEEEELSEDITLNDGTVITWQTEELDEDGNPTGKLVPRKIPFYKTKMYPVIKQDNVVDFLTFLGEPDTDKIADQQNTINIMCTKINDCLMAAGSYIILPPDARIKTDGTEAFHIRLTKNDLPYANYIRSVDCHPQIDKFLLWIDNCYQQARDLLGITDSFQGKKDTTARSGAAKQFAAAQAAGRLESKRILKAAAFAKIFEMMFKLKLAYADEKRFIISEDDKGKHSYDVFDRYEFLEKDAAGNYVWNDDFLFEADLNTPLATNRGAMWKENLAHFQMGAFGNPQDINTLIQLWDKQEKAHYPGASETKQFFQQIKAEQEKQMKEEMEKRDALLNKAKGAADEMAQSKAMEDTARLINAQAFQQAAKESWNKAQQYKLNQIQVENLEPEE